ncbi:coronin-7 isoform X1 [Engraulis encrasicolus]|uniref:coronin-7 isoform X1 n=1 Tax=Engraulis encrasicolus TaxID=184585 RepID=UPI002FD1A528
MNRFKTSKFKNTTPKISKRDGWVSGVRAGSNGFQGNLIKASCDFVAFNTDQGGGGMVGLTTLEAGADGKWPVNHLACHGDQVTDLDFSPFDNNLLATCSADESVKLWRLRGVEEEQTGEPEVTVSPGDGRLETVLFHPAAQGLLAVSSSTAVQIWDVTRNMALAVLEQHPDQLQSFAWKQDGSLMATSCKDKKLRIFDPRAQLTAIQSVSGLANNRDSRVLWVRDDWFVSTGFNQVRQQEVRLWDSRKLNSSLASASLSTSTGILMPLFDQDSGLLVAAGKGEPVINCFEVSSVEPFLPQVSQCVTEAPSRGVALVPKLALDVTSCEVMRVLQLNDNFIVPVNYHVPRKAGQDFHADLYPDTAGQTAAMSAEEWWAGENKEVEKVSLNPAKRSQTSTKPLQTSRQPAPPLTNQKSKEKSMSSSELSSGSSSVAPSRSPSSTSGLSSGCLPSPASTASSKQIQGMLGPSSKFRHIQGNVQHRDTHITNLRGLNLTTPGECDGFCSSSQHVAVPLNISGGQIAVFELSQPGKLPDTSLPTIQNSVSVADFCWDPFNPHRLTVAGEDAKIRTWLVPEGGLTDTLTEPEQLLQGHTEKIYSIKYHPHASGLLVSSSYDLTVRLWDVQTGNEIKKLLGHEDQIFGMAWSPDGTQLATVCKDGKVRIYDPRKSDKPIQEGEGPEGHRGARIVWVLEGKYLLVSGFDSRSERQLYLICASDVSAGPVGSVSADVSPSTLIPFYDPDTSVAFLSGKGDTRVYIYEIVSEEPYFLECSSFQSSEPHKGFSFLPKTLCDVRDVEIARALRLSKTTIEPVAFRVPRVRKEFFQDDVYPETAVWWESSLSASSWLSGGNAKHRKISMQPKDMTPVSEAPKEAPVRKYLPSSHYLEEKSDEQKKDELLSAMVAKLGNLDDEPLPQESFEGVDEDEWDD